MKKTIKAVLFLLFLQASACYAVDCYGGSIEYVKDCFALGGCSWLSSNDGLGSVHTKARSYRCKDGSEYMLVCSKTQVSNFFGSGHEQYAACSDVSKKEYLVKVGAKQTKLNPEEERIARKKAKEEYERETKKANQNLLAQKAAMNKAKLAGKKNREKTKKGILVDSRDGKKYKTVQIGKQNWMAENLNYDYKLNGKSYGSMCSEKDDSKCTKYGRLYNVMAATDSAGIIGEDNHACFHRDSVLCPQGSSGRVIQGVCPDGWHIPTKSDWDGLFSMLAEADSSEFGYRKKFPHLMSSDGEWDYVQEGAIKKNDFFPEYSYSSFSELHYGTDDYGFSALPSGSYSGYENPKYGGPTDFWEYMEDGTEHGILSFVTEYDWSTSKSKYARMKKAWISLRCIENDASVSKLIAKNRKRIEDMAAERTQYIEKNGGRFIDERDGNEYRTIRIGELNWMAENLRYNRTCGFSEDDDNNDVVECVTGDKEDGGDNVGNNYTIMEAFAYGSDGSVCPEGWHLPSTAEWESLRISVGNFQKLYANNQSRYKFEYKDSYGFAMERDVYWVSDSLPMEKMREQEMRRWIKHNLPQRINAEDSRIRVYLDGASGLLDDRNNSSVRCVQGVSNSEKAMAKASSLAKFRDKYIYENGGTFVDKRDGQEYRGIQIGDRIWMAENLKFENKKSSAHESHLGLNNVCLKDGGGCYYQWMLAQGRGLPGLAVEACPSGWRLPDTSDVKALFRTVGGRKNAGNSLKQKSSWSKNGLDLYGFSAERMPYPNDPGEKYGSYALWKDGVPFWTSTEVDGRFSYAANDLVMTMFFEDNGDAASVRTSPKGAYLPIRCVAKSEKKSGVTWNRDKPQNSADDAMDGMKKGGGKKKHWVPVSIFAGVALAGGVIAFVFDKKAEHATATAPTTAEEYQSGLDDAKKHQTIRNVGIGVMAAGLLAVGITFLF